MVNYFSEGEESDSEPINLKLFSGLKISFLGLLDNAEDFFRKVVQQLGGQLGKPCDYTFTTLRCWNSLVKANEIKENLYNVTYIRDCIDANKLLEPAKYRFTTAHRKVNQYSNVTEFQPCCAVFHGNKKSCEECERDVLGSRQEKKQEKKPVASSKARKSFPKIEIKAFASETAMNKAHTETRESTLASKPPQTQGVKRKRTYHGVAAPWERWEKQLLVDYLVHNTQLEYVKGVSIYQKMNSEGFLTHRTPEALRHCFRVLILPNIETFDLPKPIMAKFKQIRELNKRTKLSQIKISEKFVNPKFATKFSNVNKKFMHR